MSSIRILIADDHEDWRREVRLLLQARPEWQIICEVSDGLEAIQKAEELKPDLFLLDVGLPNLNGIEVARRIQERSPDSKIVFVTPDGRPDVVDVALSTGAQGYVYKASAQSDLLPAIDTVLQGRKFVSSLVVTAPFSDQTDHSHFEELAALEAGGYLTDEESVELHEHIKICAQCRRAEEDFSRLVRFGLPLTVSPVREFMDGVKTRPDYDVRARFLQRAKREGVVLSPAVEGSARPNARRVAFLVAAAAALAAAIGVSVFYGTYLRPASGKLIQAQQQAARLNQENSALTASLSQLNESLAAQRREIQSLRAQLGNDASARQSSGQSPSPNGPLPEEAQNQNLVDQARGEVAQVDELRADDEAALVAQQMRNTELTDKLRVANATVDMERQLAAEGKDVRELMAARQLHIIDIRDTDPNGDPGRAFGRVFLTEGKSLTFYAFDLNEDGAENAKRSFQVWAVPQTSKASSRSLGFLHEDAKAQGRWVLDVENAELVKDIGSVFVTVEPVAGGKQPSGPKMLYAYLGDANHP